MVAQPVHTGCHRCDVVPHVRVVQQFTIGRDQEVEAVVSVARLAYAFEKLPRVKIAQYEIADQQPSRARAALRTGTVAEVGHGCETPGGG